MFEGTLTIVEKLSNLKSYIKVEEDNKTYYFYYNGGREPIGEEEGNEQLYYRFSFTLDVWQTYFVHYFHYLEEQNKTYLFSAKYVAKKDCFDTANKPYLNITMNGLNSKVNYSDLVLDTSIQWGKKNIVQSTFAGRGRNFIVDDSSQGLSTPLTKTNIASGNLGINKETVKTWTSCEIVENNLQYDPGITTMDVILDATEPTAISFIGTGKGQIIGNLRIKCHIKQVWNCHFMIMVGNMNYESTVNSGFRNFYPYKIENLKTIGGGTGTLKRKTDPYGVEYIYANVLYSGYIIGNYDVGVEYDAYFRVPIDQYFEQTINDLINCSYLTNYLFKNELDEYYVDDDYYHYYIGKSEVLQYQDESDPSKYYMEEYITGGTVSKPQTQDIPKNYFVIIPIKKNTAFWGDKLKKVYPFIDADGYKINIVKSHIKPSDLAIMCNNSIDYVNKNNNNVFSANHNGIGVINYSIDQPRNDFEVLFIVNSVEMFLTNVFNPFINNVAGLKLQHETDILQNDWKYEPAIYNNANWITGLNIANGNWNVGNLNLNNNIALNYYWSLNQTFKNRIVLDENSINFNSNYDVFQRDIAWENQLIAPIFNNQYDTWLSNNKTYESMTRGNIQLTHDTNKIQSLLNFGRNIVSSGLNSFEDTEREKITGLGRTRNEKGQFTGGLYASIGKEATTSFNMTKFGANLISASVGFGSQQIGIAYNYNFSMNVLNSRMDDLKGRSSTYLPAPFDMYNYDLLPNYLKWYEITLDDASKIKMWNFINKNGYNVKEELPFNFYKVRTKLNLISLDVEIEKTNLQEDLKDYIQVDGAAVVNSFIANLNNTIAVVMDGWKDVDYNDKNNVDLGFVYDLTFATSILDGEKPVVLQIRTNDKSYIPVPASNVVWGGGGDFVLSQDWIKVVDEDYVVWQAQWQLTGMISGYYLVQFTNLNANYTVVDPRGYTYTFTIETPFDLPITPYRQYCFPTIITSNYNYTPSNADMITWGGGGVFDKMSDWEPTYNDDDTITWTCSFYGNITTGGTFTAHFENWDATYTTQVQTDTILYGLDPDEIPKTATSITLTISTTRGGWVQNLPTNSDDFDWGGGGDFEPDPNGWSINMFVQPGRPKRYQASLIFTITNISTTGNYTLTWTNPNLTPGGVSISYTIV